MKCKRTTSHVCPDKTGSQKQVNLCYRFQVSQLPTVNVLFSLQQINSTLHSLTFSLNLLYGYKMSIPNNYQKKKRFEAYKSTRAPLILMVPVFCFMTIAIYYEERVLSIFLVLFCFMCIKQITNRQLSE